MGIDTSIIARLQTPQIKLNDPLEMYGKSLALKGLIGQQELQGFQLQTARDDRASQERFKALFAGNPDPSVAEVMAIDPKLGQAYQKFKSEDRSRQITDTMHQSTTGKNNQAIFTAAMEQSANGLIGVRDRAGAEAWKLSQFDDPIIGPVLRKLGKTPEGSIAEIPQDPARLPEWIQQNALGMKKFVEGATARGAEQRAQMNANVNPNGTPNEPAIAARERIARAGDPTRVAIANANLRGQTQALNTNLGPADQVAAPQVGAPPQGQQPMPAVQPGGAATTWNGAPLRTEAASRVAATPGAIPQGPAIPPGADAAQVLFNGQPGMRQDGAPPGTTGAYMPPEGSAFSGGATSNTAPITAPASATGSASGNPNSSARGRANAGNNDRTKLKQGERFTADGNIESVPGSDVYIRQSDKHGKDYGALSAVKSKTASAVAKIDEILSAKYKDAFDNNFGGYTGYATRLLPGQTQDVGRQIDSLKSDMKNAGLELIRAGGSIGQMTEREWPIVERMIANIDPRLGVDKARTEFERVKTYLKKIQDNAGDAYQVEWGDTQFSKRTPTRATEADAPNRPKLGERKDGYIFKGGDPSKPASWEKER